MHIEKVLSLIYSLKLVKSLRYLFLLNPWIWHLKIYGRLSRRFWVIKSFYTWIFNTMISIMLEEFKYFKFKRSTSALLKTSNQLFVFSLHLVKLEFSFWLWNFEVVVFWPWNIKDTNFWSWKVKICDLQFGNWKSISFEVFLEVQDYLFTTYLKFFIREFRRLSNLNIERLLYLEVNSLRFIYNLFYLKN